MIMILVIVVTLIVFVISRFVSKYLDSAYHSLVLSNLIFEITDGFNENVRLYVITGDNLYLNNYKSILDAMAGKIAWSDIQDQVISYNNQEISFEDLIDMNNFTSQERDLIKQIRDLRRKLLWIEINAINTAQGRADTDGTAKKLFDSRKINTFIEFTGNTGTIDDIENKKTALKMFNGIHSKTHIKLMDTIFKLRENLSIRLLKTLDKYKIVYVFFLVVLITVSVIDFNKISQTTDYNEGLLSIYNWTFLTFAILTVYTGLSVYSSGFMRLRTYILAGMMQDISSRLTKDVRDFAKTSDNHYFNNYWKIVKVSNGTIQWKELDKTIKYWRLVGSPFSFYSDNSNKNLLISIMDLLEKNGFTEEEMLLFREARSESNTLIWSEIKSFNWNNKHWDKDNIGRKIFNQQNYHTFIPFSGTYNNTEDAEKSTLSSNENDSEEKTNHPDNPKQASVDILYDYPYIITSAMIKRNTSKGEALANKRTREVFERSKVLFNISSITFILITVFLMYQTN